MESDLKYDFVSSASELSELSELSDFCCSVSGFFTVSGLFGVSGLFTVSGLFGLPDVPEYSGLLMLLVESWVGTEPIVKYFGGEVFSLT
jgi:hypothetical protein